MIKVKDVLKNCSIDTEFGIYLPIMDNRIGRFGWDDKENPQWVSVTRNSETMDRRSLVPEEYHDRYCFIGSGSFSINNNKSFAIGNNRLKAIIPLIVFYLFPEDYTDEEKES